MVEAELTSPQGRPLQARALRTRKKLLEATLASLVEDGYAGTTTTAVCKRAGVSQGALYKHFDTKTVLYQATIEHLFADLIAGYRKALARVLAGQEDKVGAAIRILWITMTSPALVAAFELYQAARTDDDLRAALAPVLAQHRNNIRAEARAIFPEAADHPDFPSVIDGVVATLQGAAVTAALLPDPASSELAFLERVTRAELSRIR